MAVLPKQTKYTPEEYLALEEKAEFRSEYWNGRIIRMSGGTGNHNSITLNIAGALKSGLREKCRTFAIDVKVWINSWESYAYPDVFVICQEPRYYKKRRDVFTNPSLIIEVLSNGTKIFDKGDKFLAYQTIDSLQEYVLVDQYKFLVEQYTKQQDGKWTYQATIGQDSEITLHSVGQTLKLSEIYDLVEFEEE
ncbi:MAG: Uma2 family endonuclease [Acidobacteria bacterium]|nr:Uma2 family endonuclease [Acidobacteriota bacterium]